jgi:hypothetical protein
LKNRVEKRTLSKFWKIQTSRRVRGEELGVRGEELGKLPEIQLRSLEKRGDSSRLLTLGLWPVKAGTSPHFPFGKKGSRPGFSFSTFLGSGLAI